MAAGRYYKFSGVQINRRDKNLIKNVTDPLPPTAPSRYTRYRARAHTRTHSNARIIILRVLRQRNAENIIPRPFGYDVVGILSTSYSSAPPHLSFFFVILFFFRFTRFSHFAYEQHRNPHNISCAHKLSKTEYRQREKRALKYPAKYSLENSISPPVLTHYTCMYTVYRSNSRCVRNKNNENF